MRGMIDDLVIEILVTSPIVLSQIIIFIIK